jgi:hypothetical protein
MEKIGCATCFGDDATSAVAHLRSLPRDVCIVEESHFMVRVIACGLCEQQFASVFCERIDWTGGNDPTETLYIPVSRVEVDGLVAAGEAGAERALHALSGPRRFLVRFWPSTVAEAAVTFTTAAVHVPRHD